MKINRRRLLSLSARVLVLALLLTAIPLASGSRLSYAKTTEYDVTAEADLVIVGGGGTGMAAALGAIDAGAEKVILVEKLAVLGGAMRIRTGQFSAADTILQHEEGLNEDSKERYKEEIMGFATLHDGHPIEYLIDVYVEHATEAWDWIYELGVKDYAFNLDDEGSRAVINTGHMPYQYKRTYVPLPKADSQIANPAIEVMEREILKDDRIQVFTEVEGRKLTVNEQGQVNGVEGVGSDGQSYLFSASRGVIMSTGGYAGNPALFEAYSTNLTSLLTAALPSNDGFGLRMMQEVGAALTDEAMMWIETYPKGIPNDAAEVTGTNASTGTYYTGGILVNTRGERFVNETAWDDEVRNQALKEQPDNYMFEIYTDEIFAATEGMSRGMYSSFAEGGRYADVVVAADSLAELAEKIGVPTTALEETVAVYNDHVESLETDEFGREFVAKEGENRVEAINKIEGDHYYAVRIQPIVLSSRGGILVNDQLQVLTADGTVIPGLYAAGEVVGQMWGRTIAPGVAMTGVMAFGRFAAENAVTLDPAEGYEPAPALDLLPLELFERVSVDVEAGRLQDLVNGVFLGSARGMNGDVVVQVIVEGGAVTAIDILEHEETAGLADPALEQIPQAIIDNQSIAADVVAGATMTSNAILEAVAAALAGDESEEDPEAIVPAFSDPDVVVVGAGSAGVNAALAAAAAGARVYLIEKNADIGGSIRYAGGTLSGAGTVMQADAGIEDDVDKFIADIERMGQGKNNALLTEVHVDHAAAAIDWLDSLGLDFGDRIPTQPATYDAFDTDREHRVTGGGVQIMEGLRPLLEEQIDAEQIVLLLNTEVASLKMDDEVVTGVLLTDGSVIEAPSVVLATGGYGHNEEMLNRYNLENVLTMAPAFVTGDGYVWAEEAGADFANMDYLPAYPGGVPVSASGFDLSVAARVTDYPGTIWIDRDGNRLINEVDCLDSERKALWASVPENIIYIVFPEEVVAEGDPLLLDGFSPQEDWSGFLAEVEKEEVAWKADSISELAQKIGVDADQLTATVDQFVRVSEGSEKDPFGRVDGFASFATGPFYALKTVPYVMLTKGGPTMNERAQVTNEAGEPIVGLYQAGEIIGGANIGGAANIGGLANTITLVWGNIAGQSAAEDALAR